MKFTDYIITPKDIKELLGELKPRDFWAGVIFLLFVAIVPLLSQLSYEGAFFLVFLFAMFYWRVDSSVPIGLGIVCLILVPVFMYGIQNIFLEFGMVGAKELAIWAFYFLSIGVIRQIGEFAVEAKSKNRE